MRDQLDEVGVAGVEHVEVGRGAIEREAEYERDARVNDDLGQQRLHCAQGPALYIRQDGPGLGRGAGEHDVAGAQRRAVLELEGDVTGHGVDAHDPGAELHVEALGEVPGEHVDALGEGEALLPGAKRGRMARCAAAGDAVRPARQRGGRHRGELGEQVRVVGVVVRQPEVDGLAEHAPGGAAASDAAALVEDEDLAPGGTQLAGAGEASDPCADDDDVVHLAGRIDRHSRKRGITREAGRGDGRTRGRGRGSPRQGVGTRSSTHLALCHRHYLHSPWRVWRKLLRPGVVQLRRRRW